MLYANKLKCDAFEKARKNLIEAKSANSREHLRMAIGQLLDYEWQGKAKWGELHKAILVPDRPSEDEIEWLQKTSASASYGKSATPFWTARMANLHEVLSRETRRNARMVALRYRIFMSGLLIDFSMMTSARP